MSKKDGKVLLMLYPGCISFETMLAVQLLGSKLELKTATPSGQSHVDESGMKIMADFSYLEALEETYSVILIPGGDPESIMEMSVVDVLIQEAAENGTIIAGICAGVLVLAKTGILKGKTITHNYCEKYAANEIVEFTRPYWEGVNWSDVPLAVDNKIVTALPFAHIEFAVMVARLAGCIEEPECDFLSSYYKGFPDNSDKIVRKFWETMATNDFHEASKMFSHDFELIWPQSGEIIKGGENFALINSNYPSLGKWQFKINRIFSRGTEVVSDVTVTDGAIVGRAITFSTVNDGLIAKQVEFWPDEFAAPEWRKNWVEKVE